VLSAIGGFILVSSAAVFFVVLIQAHRGEVATPEEYCFSTAVHEARTLPVALNGFALWLTLMVALTVLNYGYPIAQLMVSNNTVPVIPIGVRQ
jgi:cytochrome c oxidase subunit 1